MKIFIIDHHEIPKIIKKKISIFINPHLSKNEEISSSGLVYFIF
jgi:single-stranded DNA-specific DHH superfamily exonuclease